MYYTCTIYIYIHILNTEMDSINLLILYCKLFENIMEQFMTLFTVTNYSSFIIT